MFENISKKSISILRIRYSLFSALLTFSLGILGVINFDLYIRTLIIYLIFFFFVLLIYCPMKYKCTLFSVSDEHIKMSYGVIFSQNITLNINNIQYIELSQSIEERLLSVATLILYTAGGKIKIPHLSTKRALYIKKQLYRSVGNE